LISSLARFSSKKLDRRNHPAATVIFDLTRLFAKTDEGGHTPQYAPDEHGRLSKIDLRG